MKTTNLSLVSKVMLLIVGLLFIASLFLPLWRIELDAPQYPEGLTLQLHANKIGGDVAIINGLNHYIGMATLHTENFFEFKILPYIFGAFGVIAFVLIFINKRKLYRKNSKKFDNGRKCFNSTCWFNCLASTC